MLLVPTTCRFRNLLTAGILVTTVLPAYAPSETSSTDLLVTATVADSCAINSTSALTFGIYDPVGANSASTGTDLVGNGMLTITCTKHAPATITLGQGMNPASGSTDAAPLRQMKQGGFVLAYQLNQDSDHTRSWGNAPDTGLQRTGAGISDSISVYGVVPRGQSVPAGSYSDTVVITITF